MPTSTEVPVNTDPVAGGEEAAVGAAAGDNDGLNMATDELTEDVTNELGNAGAGGADAAGAEEVKAAEDMDIEEAMAGDDVLKPLAVPGLPPLKPVEDDDAPLATLKKPAPPKKTSAARSQPRYYAVRVGYAASPDQSHVSTIRSAIFLRWADVKDFVEFTTAKLNGEGGQVSSAVAMAAAAGGIGSEPKTSEDAGASAAADETATGEEAPANKDEGVIRLPFHHNVEYKVFDEIERAERYLKKVIPEFNKGPNKKAKGKNKVTAAKAGKTKIKGLSRKLASMPDYPPPKNFNPPTKKWENMYKAAVQYKADNGNLDVPQVETGELAELSKWVRYQRTSYRYYLEDPMGGRHSMTEEKVNRLKEIGFEWIVSDKKKWLAEEPGSAKKKRGRPRKTAALKLAEEAATTPRKVSQNRPIRPKWLEMLKKLKDYKEQNGTIEISNDETDEELSNLRQWCKNQRNMHIRWRQGHDVGMTQEKADLLKEAGMEFPPAWEDMYIKIVQYKAQNNGSIEITPDYDPILAAWMTRQNEVLGRHLQGKSTRLSDDQAMRLMALGFQGGRGSVSSSGAVSVTGKSVASRDFDAKWDEMLSRLSDYKAEHGHCNVPTTSGTELAHWVAAQRRMYNKLIAGKPGKRAVLDAVKMQRLTELGFQFRPRGSYTAWDDNLKGVYKFREENGHCRIPVNHPELGSFVKLVRRDYKNYSQGKPSSMTPERENLLKEVGFIFEGGKTPQRAHGPIKSWNERLEELLQYKTEYGHTVVPQNSGQLGAWVHSQRVHYKKYKEGKKSQMTAEKALKLTEIGFCFNASDRYRGNKRHQRIEHEEEEMDPTQQHAQQQYQYQQQYQQQQQQLQHHMQETVHVPALQPALQPYGL